MQQADPGGSSANQAINCKAGFLFAPVSVADKDIDALDEAEQRQILGAATTGTPPAGGGDGDGSGSENICEVVRPLAGAREDDAVKQ